MNSRWIAVALLALGMMAPLAHAKIYKWVDETGKVRFSDTPPANQRTEVDEVEIDARAGGLQPGSIADKLRKPLPKAQPIHARAGEENRAVFVENILFDLDAGQGDASLVVGKHYDISKTYWNRFYGPGDKAHFTAAICDTRGQDLQATHLERLVAQSKQELHEQLMKYIAGLGYRTAGAGNAIFRQQEQVAAELSIAAILKDVFVEECGMGSTMASPSFNRTYVRIEWQLFNNLEKQVVLKLTTEGFNDSWDQPPRNKGTPLGLMDASKDAMARLFTHDAFVAALYAGATALPQVAALPVSITVSASAEGDSFVAAIDGMKAGIVTVRTAAGHGSGFVITGEGHAITNYHVVGESARVLLIVEGAEVYADVVLTDKARDVALLKTVAPLAVAPLTRISTKARLGEAIYIVGTPLAEELSHTVTKGIVSGFRKRENLDFYQTDAAVNPGNSGGPVFNEKGELIAIAVQGIFTTQGASLNTNFLIPVEDAFRRLGIEVNHVE